MLEQLLGGGIRTHALFRVPELKSGALDRSAILTPEPRNTINRNLRIKNRITCLQRKNNCQEWGSNPRSLREPELKSGALDRSAILTPEPRNTKNSSVSESQFKNQKYNNVLATIVRSGVRTHALFREPELKSGALDRSAVLTLNQETRVR
ncbi:hypothetical protein TNCV_2974291 [Trichonephila clavipes]|nr:hypothetical protein TNCV_2974291 [Trichonephila clavipes]